MSPTPRKRGSSVATHDLSRHLLATLAQWTGGLSPHLQRHCRIIIGFRHTCADRGAAKGLYDGNNGSLSLSSCL